MTSVLTAPPVAEPVSLAEARAHLRIAHDDEDPFISRLMVAARRLVEAQTGLVLMAQGWSVFRDDWPDGGVVHLPIAPIIAVNDVLVHGEDDVAAGIDPSHYYVDAPGRRLLLRGSRVWARPGRIGNGIEIALTAGFAAVPPPLHQAMLQLVAHWYEHRAGADAPLTVAAMLGPFRELRL